MPAPGGIARDRRKVLLHLMAGSREDVETERASFQDMRSRGLGAPLLVVTDGAPVVMIRAAEERFPREVPEPAGPEFKERVRALLPGAVPGDRPCAA